MNKKIKEYFSTKTAEQIFSLCLLVTIVILMLFCMITRLCGGLWFSADLSKVEVPSIEWQNNIKVLLLIFELTFVYKILCRTNWIVCIIISTIQGIINCYLPSHLSTNIFNLVCYFLIPICFQRRWFTLLDSAFMYAINMLYCAVFIVGRIGNFEDANYNFIYGILSTIDYKLFTISLYLLIKNFGGIKLWKNQKRLICQIDQKKKEI